MLGDDVNFAIYADRFRIAPEGSFGDPGERDPALA